MKLKVLKEPYPFDSRPQKVVRSAFLFGLSVFLFLFIFQPFGISNYQSDNKWLHLLGYGAVTTSVLLINHLLFTALFPTWFNKKTWSIGKNILFVTYMFFCIGLGNLIYSMLLNFLHFSWESFFFYQVITLLVGFFPVTISTFFVYYRRLEKALNEAKNLNQKLDLAHQINIDKVQIPSQNQSENLEIVIDELLFVKAIENYVEVHLSRFDEVQKVMLRNTLKNISISLAAHQQIQKCHRSYLVNLEKVQEFKGNAQGLSLIFSAEGTDEVPVSRAFVKEIKKHLKQ